MPGSLGETVAQATRDRFHTVPDSGCAAVEYTNIVSGSREFAVYYRLLPWDHAAPALMLIEAGGRVEHLDGTPYSVRSENQLTIVARDAMVSGQVRMDRFHKDFLANDFVEAIRHFEKTASINRSHYKA